MDIPQLLREIDQELGRLHHAKTALLGLSTSSTTPVAAPAKRGPGRPKGTGKKAVFVTSPVKAKRKMSAAGRAAIAAAQKARWAKVKRAA